MLKNYCPNLSLLEQKVIDTDTKELGDNEICDLLVMNPGSHDASIPLNLKLHYRPDDWRGKTGSEILSSDNKPSVEHHKLHLYGFGPGQKPVYVEIDPTSGVSANKGIQPFHVKIERKQFYLLYQNIVSKVKDEEDGFEFPDSFYDHGIGCKCKGGDKVTYYPGWKPGGTQPGKRPCMKIYCLGGDVVDYGSQFEMKIAGFDPKECDGQCKIGENQTLTNKWLWDCDQKTEQRLVGAYVPSDNVNGDRAVIDIKREAKTDLVGWQRRPQWSVQAQVGDMGKGPTDVNNRVLKFTMKRKLEKPDGDATEAKKKVATGKDLKIA
jgi:hypothetical protein